MQSAPLFFAMLPAGLISGALLDAYCPEQGDPGSREAGAAECNGRMLWGVLLLLSMSSPVLITLLQKWVRPRPEDHQGRHMVTDVNEADPASILEHVYHDDA